MTDRELLELAAKAAGYVIDEYTDDGAWVYEKTAEPNEDGEFPVFLWRPRHDDGDALRLAVCSGISFGAGADSGRPRVAWWQCGQLHSVDMPEENPLQLPACSTEWTRRAIVSAAAEIGRTMP